MVSFIHDHLSHHYGQLGCWGPPGLAAPSWCSLLCDMWLNCPLPVPPLLEREGVLSPELFVGSYCGNEVGAVL